MRRALPVLLAAWQLGCGSPPSAPAAAVHIAVQRLAEGDDCVRVTVSDVAAPARTETVETSLSGRPASTTIVVAVQQPAGWGSGLEAVATLHLGGCATAAVDEDRATFQVGSPVTRVDLALRQPGVVADGGLDGGVDDAGLPDAGAGDGGVSDAGVPDAGAADAGMTDAGMTDAGMADAGVADAGVTDAGVTDAGVTDAGTPDAGVPDAGMVDAGLCAGVVRAVRTSGPKWTDVAPWSSQGVIAVGEGDGIGLFTAAGGFTDWSGGGCTGNFYGVWVDPLSFQAWAVTSVGFRRVDGAQQCTAVASLPGGTPQALVGLRIGGVTRLYAATTSPPTVVEVNVGQSTTTARTLPAAGAVYDVDGLDEDTLFAVGNTNQNDKGAFWRWNVGSQQWDAPATLSPANTPIYAVDVVSSTRAFAGGANGLYEWNGVGWSFRASPGFEVYGVRALSATEVYVVGPAVGGNAGFARWNGTGFTSPTRPMTGSYLARVRGADGCALWAVGESGFVVTTAP